MPFTEYTASGRIDLMLRLGYNKVSKNGQTLYYEKDGKRFVRERNVIKEIRKA